MVFCMGLIGFEGGLSNTGFGGLPMFLVPGIIGFGGVNLGVGRVLACSASCVIPFDIRATASPASGTVLAAEVANGAEAREMKDENVFVKRGAACATL